MAATFAAGRALPVDLDDTEVDEAVAPGRLAERHAIQHLLDRGQRRGTVGADVLVDQEPANLLQLLTRPLLRRLRHAEETHQQSSHPGDGTR